MFELNIRFQIAAICFLAVIVYSFLTNKSMSLRSTRYFAAMLICNILNLVFDIVSVYAVVHYRELSPWFVRAAHNLFFISLLTGIFGFYLYISNFARGGKSLPMWRQWISAIPYLLVIGLSIFGKLYYVSEPDQSYSYGPAANSIFICLVCYLFITFMDAVRGRLRKEEKWIVFFSMGIWILVGIIQYLRPELLLSGLAFTLMTSITYMSFENPKAHMDQDVGLFNGYALRLIVKEKLAVSKKPFFLLNLVMDDFELWEQRLGHRESCEILSRLAVFMEQATEGEQNIYRSGPKQLTMIMNGDKVQAEKLSERLISRLYNYLQIGNHKVHVRGRVYLVECPTYGKNVGDLSAIMKFMMENPTGSYTQATFVDNEILSNMNRITKVEEIIQAAIDNDGFNILYQPIFSTGEEKFISAEALVRLKDTTTLGFISPDEFIPIAERSGQINALGDLIFKKVCRFAREKDLINKGVKYLEINLSGVQMMDERLPKRLSQIMSVFNIQPDFINLEITETAAVESGERLLSNVLALKKTGCSFSMDDFGTGYSNLAQMATIPYELVKVDKSLIWPCFPKEEEKEKEDVRKTAQKAKNILEGIIDILHKMRIHIVAEGVETEAMAKYLTDLGVEYLQGYYFSRPIGEEEYLNFMTK